MRAITFDAYGGPEVLTLTDVPLPTPDQGQVRVSVRAAGVNPVDWKIRSGAVQHLFPVPFPHTPGLELAGVVDALGDGVTGLAVGDEVFGWAETGAYAEYALATHVAPKPPGLSWADAATLPIAGAAALRDLDRLAVRPGETLLIHGVSGVTGRFAAQVAVARGVTVIGTAGESRHEDLRSLGVTPVTYGGNWVDRVRDAASRIDAVYDAAGHGLLPGSIELRGTKDRVITIADLAAFDLGVPYSTGGDQTREVLEEAARWVTDRGVRIVHRASYPLAEAAAAQTESESGHPNGKLTLL